MGYRLGVDLGTTFTSAAVLADDAAWPAMVGLGNRAMQVPSVLFLKEDGEFLVGEAAERRGQAEPDRVVREFKRRLGDRVPILVGGTPFSAQALQARLLTWVIEHVTERQGAPPDKITVTCPANWGDFKRDLFDQAIKLAGVRDADVITEPEAVAIHYAARNTLAPGQVIAVYDLGGGTFDTAILRKTDTGFTILGTPEGIEQLGGIDFDEAVFHHTLAAVTQHLAAVLDPAGNEHDAALARLRRDCVEAKEALSADTETMIQVSLPGLSTSIRLAREQFEQLIGPVITDTVDALRRAIASAGIEPGDLHAIVLTGGSSRIPLVSRRLTEAFARPLALDTHPKHDVALGATLIDAQQAATRVEAQTPAPIAPTLAPPDDTPPTAGPDPTPAGTEQPPVAVAATPPTAVASAGAQAGDESNRRGIVLAVGAALVVVAAVAAFVLSRGGDEPSTTPSTTSSTISSDDDEKTTVEPPPSLPENVLLVTSRDPDSGATSLYEVNADTDKATKVDVATPGGANPRLPVVAPDRQSFFYVLGDEPPAPVMITAVDGTARPFFTDDSPCDAGSRPAFSPDGSQVAVICENRDTGAPGLYILALDGTLVRELDPGTSLETGGAPTWTDENAIVYGGAAPQGDELALWSVSATGDGQPAILVPPEPGFSDSHPDADGSRLLFMRDEFDGTLGGDLYIADGAGLEPLTSEGTYDSPAWSPDGERICVLDSASGTMTLWIVDVGSGERREITSLPGIPGPPAWGAR